jgi:hypothetical protein
MSDGRNMVCEITDWMGLTLLMHFCLRCKVMYCGLARLIPDRGNKTFLFSGMSRNSL